MLSVPCFQRRSLRERRKKTYKDDFDYNLSDEEGEKDSGVRNEAVVSYPAEEAASQGFITAGPGVEETMIIEKILAARLKQVWVILVQCRFIC